MPVDRTRRFQLPDIQELNKDQDAALALPLEGQHLIIGGPGTDKSVVALFRARRLFAEMGHSHYHFLAYNELLDQSNRYLFGNEPLTASKFETWFRKLWRGQFKAVPTLDPKPGLTFREIDWKAVEHTLCGSGWKPLNELSQYPLPFLVLDEGQDMPPAFYYALVQLGFENLYVVADQNQQLQPDRCSTRQDIENHSCLQPHDTLKLHANYRNTRSIALLAQHFYPDDPASPRPRLPESKPSMITPELWQYGARETLTLEEVATRILQMADRDPRKLIGIIAPNNKIREKFVDAINAASPRLDNDRPPIQTYLSGSRDALDFGRGGIMVINVQSCKGLEFEIAILVDIDDHQPRNNTDALKKRFYVMVTRAREQVILLRYGDPHYSIEKLLPDNPNILSRKNEYAQEDSDIPF